MKSSTAVWVVVVAFAAGGFCGSALNHAPDYQKRSAAGRESGPPDAKILISRPNGERRQIERFVSVPPMTNSDHDLILSGDEWYIEIDGRAYTAAPAPR